ncbi:Rpp20 subunit of nuclear RNase MRP and P-domain-containing protein [Xylariaceae sp. FL1019]|nr:Rpp20 subunit of nuclear RNase MRP and P-domain-containing protein [Xylariaceae sp. FL1019]
MADQAKRLPRQSDSEVTKKLPRVPKGSTVRRRPLPSGPVSSSHSTHTINVTPKTPFQSITTRVRKHLDKNLRQSASARGTFTNRLSQNKDASLASRVRQIQRQAKDATTNGLGLGLENSGEVLLVATGRAIEKLTNVALFFQNQNDCIVQLRTRSIAAVDDVVGPEEDGLEGDVDERARMISCLEVSIKLR